MAGGFLLVLALVLALDPVSRGRAAEIPERDARAAFLFHLTQFVTWPPHNATQFKIGIVGPDPFGPVLDELVRGEQVAGRPITIERGVAVEKLGDCQLVYISGAAREPQAKIIAAVKGRPVLLVGETENFLEQGGMIRIYRNPDRKLRLQINLTNVRAASLSVSSQLLRVADVQPGAGS